MINSTQVAPRDEVSKPPVAASTKALKQALDDNPDVAQLLIQRLTTPKLDKPQTELDGAQAFCNWLTRIKDWPAVNIKNNRHGLEMYEDMRGALDALSELLAGVFPIPAQDPYGFGVLKGMVSYMLQTTQGGVPEPIAASFLEDFDYEIDGAPSDELAFDPVNGTDTGGKEEAQTQAGADALKQLLADLDAAGSQHFERATDADIDNTDVRDYAEFASIVDCSLQMHYVHGGPSHRQGFLRALADVLNMVAEGVTPSDDWDPIATTARSFAAIDTPTQPAKVTANTAVAATALEAIGATPGMVEGAEGFMAMLREIDKYVEELPGDPDPAIVARFVDDSGHRPDYEQADEILDGYLDQFLDVRILRMGDEARGFFHSLVTYLLRTRDAIDLDTSEWPDPWTGADLLTDRGLRRVPLITMMDEPPVAPAAPVAAAATPSRSMAVDNKLAQLQSLLWSMYGVGAEWLAEIGTEHRDNIIWMASDVAEEIGRLRDVEFGAEA